MLSLACPPTARISASFALPRFVSKRRNPIGSWSMAKMQASPHSKCAASRGACKYVFPSRHPTVRILAQHEGRSGSAHSLASAARSFPVPPTLRFGFASALLVGCWGAGRSIRPWCAWSCEGGAYACRSEEKAQRCCLGRTGEDVRCGPHSDPCGCAGVTPRSQRSLHRAGVVRDDR